MSEKTQRANTSLAEVSGLVAEAVAAGSVNVSLSALGINAVVAVDELQNAVGCLGAVCDSPVLRLKFDGTTLAISRKDVAVSVTLGIVF